MRRLLKRVRSTPLMHQRGVQFGNPDLQNADGERLLEATLGTVVGGPQRRGFTASQSCDVGCGDSRIRARRAPETDFCGEGELSGASVPSWWREVSLCAHLGGRRTSRGCRGGLGEQRRRWGWCRPFTFEGCGGERWPGRGGRGRRGKRARVLRRICTWCRGGDYWERRTLGLGNGCEPGWRKNQRIHAWAYALATRVGEVMA